jgi:hypothetical protein
MPSIKWQHVWGSPLTTVKILILSTARSTAAIVEVLTSKTPLSLRTALVRVWFGTSLSGNVEIWYSEPASHGVQKVNTDGTSTLVIPSIDSEEIKNADAAYIHAHGGGLFVGHPLQYLEEYKRWIERSRKAGLEVVEQKVTGQLHT